MKRFRIDIKEKFLILYRQLNIIKIAVEYSGISIIGAKNCQEWLDVVGCYCRGGELV